jgi:hypothetical protein
VPDDLLCPSASADAPDAMVIGVVGGTVDSPHVRMLERPVPVSPAVLAATAPVGPGEVLRVAATCLKDRCRHFADDRCALGAKIVAAVPAVEDRLPRCTIRSRCRWFAERGPAACSRCPQVVTLEARRTPAMAFAADPGAPARPGPAQ